MNDSEEMKPPEITANSKEKRGPHLSVPRVLESPVSDKLIARLSLYRRLLTDLRTQGTQGVYSHGLANLIGGSAAQVRRDLMTIGFSGSPAKGYDVAQLIDRIGSVLDAPAGQQAALVGIGNLGRAILSYFAGRRPRLAIVAAFDANPEKIDGVVHGCRCYPMGALAEVISAEGVSVGIITVPAGEAQAVADQLVGVGLTSLVNFAPIRLRVSHRVYVEEIDITTSLEKAAYYARAGSHRRRGSLAG